MVDRRRLDQREIDAVLYCTMSSGIDPDLEFE